MIIYPPLIADTIPAFTIDKVIIPFTWNPAVSVSDVKGFCLQVKDQITSELIGQTVITSNVFIDRVEFPIQNLGLKASKYYKFQLAYSDNTGEYSFSSVSIGRCIGQTPRIIIEGLQSGKENENKIKYYGTCTFFDTSETIYSYCFKLRQKGKDTQRDIVLEDTGDIIYNNLDNIRPNFKLKHSLSDNSKNYTIQFYITSVNGYTGSSPEYIIKAQHSGDKPNCTLTVSQDAKAKNNGYVLLKLAALNNQLIPANTTFVIERTSDNGVTWEELSKVYISEATSDLSAFELKDCSVEQGQAYKYSIRTYNAAENNYGAQEIIEKAIVVDFEDLYLTDGERQLKISFNPAVSSLKNTIMEQKTDTIGSQYPFFFRNGQIKYKEIPISGLISYLMDEDEMFMRLKDLGITKETKSINLTGENVAAERRFKLEVLEWLTNGRPKLFRSPTEGNYVVRLMNVSMSPNTQVGRMLHSFSATGYEVSDSDIETLIKNNQVNFSHTYSEPLSALGYFVLGISRL